VSIAFAELLASPGVKETCTLRSRFGFLAIHGGSLERGTAELARSAADRADASLYAVEQPDGFRWHLPSHLTDPAGAPALAGFLEHVDLVVSLHGYGRDDWWTRLLLGGGNRELAARLAATLGAALPGFEAVADLDAIPRELRGLHPSNPANRPRQGGVQLELPPRVRNVGPHARPEYAAGLVDALVAVAA